MTEAIATTKKSTHPQIRYVLSGFVLLMLMLAMSAQCVAQDYQSMSVNEAFTGADSTTKIKAGNALIKAAEDSGNYGAQGDLYMLGYWLPRMTQTDRKTLSSLGKYRVAFLKKFLSKKMPVSGRRGVIQKLLPPLMNIARNKNFHPAVRVNAVTIIGMLYDSQLEKWPAPSPAAYTALKTLLNDASSEDFVKVAAISGIANFAEVGRGSGSNSVPGQDMKPQLAAIINGSAPGQDKWSDDLNYWMKRRAAQILGQIGTGDTVAVSTAVMQGKNLNVNRDDFWLRYDGLNSLRNLKFETVQPAQAPEMIDSVVEFVAYAMQRESNWIKTQTDELVYKNLLWNDLDLNNAKRRRSRSGGNRGGDRRGGDGDLGDGDVTGSNGGGGPRGGGSGFDGGGRGPDPNAVIDSEHPELPVFMLNDSRARAKAVLLSARDFLKVKEKGLRSIADDKVKTRIDNEILPVINELLQETELGVIDYRKLKGEEPDRRDITFRLEKIYANSAETLLELVNKGGAAGGADDAAASVFQ